MIDMDREQLGELLSAHLDGEIDDRERAFVERLLESDAEVRALYDALRQTIESVQSLPKHEAPDTLVQDIRDHLERDALLDEPDTDAARTRLSVPWLGLVSAAAVIMAATLVGINQLGRWSTSSAPGQHLVSARKQDDAIIAGKGPLSGEPHPHASDEPMSRAARSLDSKLQAGADLDTVRRHEFDQESVVLTVALADRKEVDRVVNRLTSYLEASDVVDANEPDAATSGTELSERPFFVSGKPGVNYRAEGERQLLVRIPVIALGELVNEVAAAQPDGDRVSVVANAPRRGGDATAPLPALRRRSRQVTAPPDRRKEVDSPSSAAPAGKPRPTAGDEEQFVAAVFDALGISPDILAEHPRAVRQPSEAVAVDVPTNRDRDADVASPKGEQVALNDVASEYRTNEGLSRGEHDTGKMRAAGQADFADDHAEETPRSSSRFVTIVLRITTPAPAPREPASTPSGHEGAPANGRTKSSPQSR